jgi:8-oxo-dGTP diphosphatase
LADEAHLNPAVAVDAIALREGVAGTEALLIRRGKQPWKGRLAFPGGFVGRGEDPEHAVLRELTEETGVTGFEPVLFAVHGDPHRDPRQHIVAIFYKVKVNSDAVPFAGDDAAHAEWVSIEGLHADQMAGDHIRIIRRLCE